MDVHSVIDRALSDPVFAAELFVKASTASRALAAPPAAAAAEGPPPVPEAWQEYLALFASSPAELARLTAAPVTFDGITSITTSMTTTTITTATTLACSVTSTTSTTTTTTTTHVMVEEV